MATFSNDRLKKKKLTLCLLAKHISTIEIQIKPSQEYSKFTKSIT